MKLNTLLFLLILGLGFVACSDDDDICDTENITYTNTVGAIISTNCALSGCHVDGNEQNAFFSFEGGYAAAKIVADFGRIEGAIKHEAGFSAMPKGKEMLDQCTIDKIVAWLDAGAPE